MLITPTGRALYNARCYAAAHYAVAHATTRTISHATYPAYDATDGLHRG
jgi:hypothetical protein